MIKVVCSPMNTMSSTVEEEKVDERKTTLIKGTGTPAEEKEEEREQEKAT
jgi:hypothetical protein